jgi:hypothetical protein
MSQGESVFLIFDQREKMVAQGCVEEARFDND